MKHLYLILVFFISTMAFSQQKTSAGEIEGLSVYPNPVTNGKVFIKTKDNSPKKIMILTHETLMDLLFNYPGQLPRELSL